MLWPLQHGHTDSHRKPVTSPTQCCAVTLPLQRSVTTNFVSTQQATRCTHSSKRQTLLLAEHTDVFRIVRPSSRVTDYRRFVFKDPGVEETSGINTPAIQRKILKDLNPQHHRCVNLKAHKYSTNTLSCHVHFVAINHTNSFQYLCRASRQTRSKLTTRAYHCHHTVSRTTCYSP